MFLFISPFIIFWKNLAFFSPVDVTVLFILPVIIDSNIKPLLISINLPVLLSIISWPRDPKIFVSGSIYVNVPRPVIWSLIYNPVLYILFSSTNFKLIVLSISFLLTVKDIVLFADLLISCTSSSIELTSLLFTLYILSPIKKPLSLAIYLLFTL